MSLIREKSPARQRDVIPSLTRTYVLIALAVLTLGVAMYPDYSTPSYWSFRHGFARVYQPYRYYEHHGHDYEPGCSVMGIDLGHAYSRAALMRNGTIEMITTAEGSPEIPSWGGTWSFNRQLNRTNYYDYRTGQENEPPVSARSGWQNVLQYATLGQTHIFQERWPAEAYTLWHIRNLASNQIGEPVLHAVVTMPYDTSDVGRQALRHSASLAGLNVLRITNTPTAAGISYQLDQSSGESKLMVIDLGAEALRVTALDIDVGVFEVLEGSESTALGGDTYNQRILDWMIENTAKAEGEAVLPRLVQEAEKAKRSLSNNTLAELGLDTDVDAGAPQLTLSREEFERMTQDLVDRSAGEIAKVLLAAGLNSTSIDHVILTEGSSKLPHFKSMVKALFQESGTQLSDDALAEAAARGTAIQASNLSDYADIGCPVIDITPFSIGIETSGGLFEVIISKFQILPIQKSLVYTAPEDQHQSTLVRVYGGTRRLVRSNQKLGEIELPNLAPGSNITITLIEDADFNLIIDVKNESK